MIIAITGKAGSGKDTIADYLCDKYNYNRIALADPIKRLVKDVFVLNDMQVYDRIEREKPLENWDNWSVRKFLQVIGTELFRNNIDDSIWVKSLWYRIKTQLDKNFVIPDLRFPNELQYFNTVIPKGQFESWKVTRNGCNGNVGVQGHSSESFDLKTDYIIENNSTFQDLFDIVNLTMHGG